MVADRVTARSALWWSLPEIRRQQPSSHVRRHQWAGNPLLHEPQDRTIKREVLFAAGAGSDVQIELFQFLRAQLAIKVR